MRLTIFAALLALMTPWYGRLYLHMLQLEGYKPGAFFRWMLQNARRAVLPPVLIAVGAAMLNLWADWAAFALTLLAFAGWGWMIGRAPVKKPLVWTARAKRLCAAMAATFFLVVFVTRVVPAVALFPLAAWVAAWAAWPLEAAVNRRYFLDARKRLAAHPGLIRVGITGSYGKTSAKFILASILSEKYKVLATPSSFNTPMGLTRVIREQLLPEHEVFIAEMGAKHRGDIAELCALVQPEVGMINNIGYQHLETFGSIEAVAATKYELIEALPPNGVAVFAADGGGWADKLYRRPRPQKSLRAGLMEGLEELPLDATARDLEVGAFGSRFTFVDAQGSTIECRTKLLGRHNISNILLCAAAARALGLTLEEIARGVEKLEPIEHRLQLLPSPAGLIVIDDAFNANPAGTRAALEVLARFEGKKIIVTPGLVELGDREEEENHAFGRAMAAVCDEVILVGAQRTQAMERGLLAAGYPEKHIHIVASLNEASELLPRLARAGDAVLFENDLPDNMT